MPKYKPSKGKIGFKTVYPEEFVAWFRKELNNFTEWNPLSVKKNGDNIYITKQWKITLSNNFIKIESEEPIVYIRKGLKILMGSGRMEIDSY